MSDLPEPTTIPDEVVRASGYKSGYRTPAEFKALYGFDPAQYPQYYRITSTDLVVVKRLLIEHLDTRRVIIRQNWARLGIAN